VIFVQFTLGILLLCVAFTVFMVGVMGTLFVMDNIGNCADSEELVDELEDLQHRYNELVETMLAVEEILDPETPPTREELETIADLRAGKCKVILVSGAADAVPA